SDVATRKLSSTTSSRRGPDGALLRSAGCASACALNAVVGLGAGIKSAVWHDHGKAAATARRAVEPNFAAQVRHQPARDGQAKSKPFRAVACVIIHLEKFFEDAGLMFGRNANSCIGDAHNDALITALRFHADAAGGRVFDGVAEQV